MIKMPPANSTQRKDIMTKRYEYTKRNREKRRAEGKCPLCGNGTLPKEVRACEDCKKQERARYKRHKSMAQNSFGFEVKK